MPAKPVDVGGKHFPTQQEALQYFKEMLGRYPKGQPITGGDAEDLTALLERHIHRDEKVGSGVAFFKVDDDMYGWRCFWVVRLDGSEDDLSYIRCITGRWK